MYSVSDIVEQEQLNVGIKNIKSSVDGLFAEVNEDKKLKLK